MAPKTALLVSIFYAPYVAVYDMFTDVVGLDLFSCLSGLLLIGAVSR
jgi:hypothetical protein